MLNDANELKEYLTLLQNHLGEHSFSLVLTSARHAINLNFDARSNCWLLIDPNNLPGQTFIHSHVLAEQLIKLYGNKTGLVMETDIYSSTQNKESMQDAFHKLTELPDWKQLYHKDKLNTEYEDHISQLLYAIRREDKAWIAEKIIQQDLKVTVNTWCWAVQNNHLDLIELMIKHSEPVPDLPLYAALKTGNFTAANILIEHINLKNASRFSYNLASSGNIPALKYMASHNIPLNNDALTVALMHHQLATADFLRSQGLTMNEINLFGAIINNNTTFAKHLIEYGAPISQTEFEATITQGNIPLAEYLLEKGAKVPKFIKYYIDALDNQQLTMSKEKASSASSYLPFLLYQSLKAGNVHFAICLMEHGAALPPNLDIPASGLTNTLEHHPEQMGQAVQILSMACEHQHSNLVSAMLESGVTPTHDMLSHASDVGDLKTVKILSQAMLKQILVEMSTQDKLIKLALPEMIVAKALSDIQQQIISEIDENNVGSISKKELKHQLVDKLQGMGHDKGSELGKLVQQYKNPKLDRVFGITTRLQASFKNELQSLRASIQAEEKTEVSHAKNKDQNTPKLN